MKRVVIIDDNEDILEIVSLALRPDDVTTVTDPRDVLDEAVWEGIDAAIVDLMMPTMHGRDVLQWLAEHAPHVRRIALTAAPTLVDEALPYMDVLLIKPASIQAIRRAVDGR